MVINFVFQRYFGFLRKIYREEGIFFDTVKNLYFRGNLYE